MTAVDNNFLFRCIWQLNIIIKRDFGFDVDKRKISTKTDIKSFGTFEAEARLFTGIVAQFNVSVTEE